MQTLPTLPLSLMPADCPHGATPLAAYAFAVLGHQYYWLPAYGGPSGFVVAAAGDMPLTADSGPFGPHGEISLPALYDWLATFHDEIFKTVETGPIPLTAYNWGAGEIPLPTTIDELGFVADGVACHITGMTGECLTVAPLYDGDCLPSELSAMMDDGLHFADLLEYLGIETAL